MNERVETLKKQNPQFKYHLFDDNDCREFIKNHFREDVLYAYDHLIPGAYKADLWRYCVLFIKGGIYLDIKYTPLNGFKFINLILQDFIYVLLILIYIFFLFFNLLHFFITIYLNI